LATRQRSRPPSRRDRNAVILSSRSRSSVLGCGVVEDRIRGRRGRALRMRTGSRAVACLIDRLASVAARRPNARPACALTRALSALRHLSMAPHGHDQTVACNRYACRCRSANIGSPGAPVDSSRCHGAGVRSSPDGSPILGLVGPRLLAYLAQHRVKTARLQTERFGSAPNRFLWMAGAARRRRRG
jgi:hypothetical protein